MSPHQRARRGVPKPVLSIAFLLFACGFTLAAAQAPFGPPAQSTQPRVDSRGEIRVQVNLVTVMANVLDKDHRPAADLKVDQFEIYDEGVRQKIEVFEPDTQTPLDIALMIDSSLSETSELDFERQAASGFIGQVVRPGDRMGVYEFSDDVTLLGDFSSDIPYLQSSLKRLVPGAGTALYDAVYLGAQALGLGAPTRRRVIVLVTDAGETTSRADFETARRAAVRADTLLYTIVIRAVQNEGGRNTAGEHAMETIGDTTGGAIYYLDNISDLVPTFNRINRELRTQYRLGFYPHPQPPRGAYRSIEVRVPDGFTVHSRKLYYSGGPSE
ncbi:MAG: VWA domain-containing protein [Candidatus Acidiferrales bacterium]